MIEPDFEGRRAESARLRKALRGLDVAVDLVLYLRQEAEERRGVPGSFLFHALREGRVHQGVIRPHGATNGATCPTDSSRSQRDSIRRKPLETGRHVIQPISEEPTFDAKETVPVAPLLRRHPWRFFGAPTKRKGRHAETTIIIDRDQREGLYELICNDLGSIEDFWLALERTKDFANAEELSLELSEDFRLLQDIGWSEHDERETFDLTMPPHDLMELLQRLHDEAVKVLVESGSEAQSSPENTETDSRAQLGYEVCEMLLAADFRIKRVHRDDPLIGHR